jgi:hypothetical protein
VRDVLRAVQRSNVDPPPEYARDRATASRQEGNAAAFDFASGWYKVYWELK